MTWILGIGAMIHVALMTYKCKYAGYAGLFLQCFWVVHSLTPGNEGFMVSNVGFILIHINTIWQWHLKEIFKK